jgi:hypothetical protein
VGGLAIACACGLGALGCSSGSAGGGAIGSATYPSDADLVAKAAVALGSCVPDDRPDGWLNLWLSRVYAPGETNNRFLGAAKCLATTGGGCIAVRTCLGLTVDQSGPCDRACSGNVATECDGNTRFVSDCSKLGQQCVSGRCKPNGAACDATSYVDACVDGVPSVCSNAVVRKGPKCADFGLACGASSPTPPSTPVCRGAGAACSATYGPYSIDFGAGLGCDGSKLRACVGNQEATVDCAALGKGFSCQTASGAYFCGLASECNPLAAKGTDTCDGTSVVVCEAGKIQRVDCRSLGFTGCDATRGICTPNGWP